MKREGVCVWIKGLERIRWLEVKLGKPGTTVKRASSKVKWGYVFLRVRELGTYLRTMEYDYIIYIIGNMRLGRFSIE